MPLDDQHDKILPIKRGGCKPALSLGGSPVEGAQGPSNRIYRGRIIMRQPSQLRDVWRSMRHRCNNPKRWDYKHYGGRGVKVCKRWDSYELFAADVGPHPGKGLTLDRIDGSKGYEPGNVRWASRTVQSRNSSGCRLNMGHAKQIRDAYKRGLIQRVIAVQFGLTQSYVSKIIRGANWK